MSQVTQITIDNVAFGTFRSNLNDTLNALNSMHSGTSRPASATTGTIWLDTTNAGSNSLTIKFFDGTDDITVADVDTSANTINFIDSTVTTELLSDLSPQLGGMLDVNGNAIGNGTEELIKFSETASAVNEITVTNSATGNAPEISATGDDTDIDLKLTPKGSGNLNLDGLIFPNADGTTGQFLKTDGSGNLSFDDAGGGGKIGQLVQASTTTETQVTSTSYTDTTLTGSITPSSATSKILVDVRGFFMIDATSNSSGRRANHRLVRTISASDTVLQTDEHTLSVADGSNNIGHIFQIGYQYLDSPSTTSACSYKIQISVDATGYRANFPHDGNKATITLMEVLA